MEIIFLDNIGRFLKMFFRNGFRRSKWYLIFLCSLFLLYSILKRTGQNVESKPKSTVNLTYVAVHIDLKGSPPKIRYLQFLLPVLTDYGVNAILLEYEDTFPYTESLENISSVNVYRKTEILTFINTAKSLNIEIIPLIQTFGHMEYVLKLEEFAHLREVKNSTKDICPSNPESKKLITAMLKQVIDLHTMIEPLQHIHIGCDEVRHLNKCPKCKERNLKTNELFVNHVQQVSSIVRELSPSIEVLIWGDMLMRNKTPQAYGIGSTEVVVWEYGANPKFNHAYFYNLHKNFKNIWIASAFKGADGSTSTIPKIKKRFLNHLSWMKFILGYKFGGENSVHNFEGIILTGWSRYSHMQPQCEILPVAMPSLVLNLLLIKTLRTGIDQGDLDLHYCKFFNKYLSKEFNYLFENNGDIEEKCAFENMLLYEEHEKNFHDKLKTDCLRKLYQRKTNCSAVKSYADVYILDGIFVQCKKVLEKLIIQQNFLQKFLVKYYKHDVVLSYIKDTVGDPTRKIKSLMKYLKNCSSHRL